MIAYRLRMHHEPTEMGRWYWLLERTDTLDPAQDDVSADWGDDPADCLAQAAKAIAEWKPLEPHVNGPGVVKMPPGSYSK